MEHIEFTKIKHLVNHVNVNDHTNVCAKILLIYAAANIEHRNCEIFTQSR